MKTLQLTSAVMHGDTWYQPGDVAEFPDQAANELILLHSGTEVETEPHDQIPDEEL